MTKKSILIGSAIGAVAAGAVAGVTVAIVKKQQNKVDYDFGLLTAPVNSLNYVKYPDSRNVVAPTIPSLFHQRPDSRSDDSLFVNKNPLNMISGGYPDLTNTDEKYPFDSYYVENYDTNTYIGIPANNPANRKIKAGLFTSRYGFVTFVGNTQHWNDGTRVTASDFINYIDAILDLGNSSLLIGEVEDYGIQGVAEYIEAQKAYFKKFNKLYANPAGKITRDANGKVTKTWPSQNAGDTTQRQTIEDAYKNVGYYGDEYSSRPYTFSPKANNYVPPGEQANLAFNKNNITQEIGKHKTAFQAANPTGSAANEWKDSLITLAFKNKVASFEEKYRLSKSPLLMPLHPSWNSEEAIENAGFKYDEMPYTGAFKFGQSVLGDNGYITYKKNFDFAFKGDVFVENIKLYFSGNPNVNYAMYQDGIVASTTVPNTQVAATFNDLNLRSQLNKTSTSTTQGFIFNLDPSSRNMKPEVDPLQYADFRKAIFYGIDREQLLKIAGEDTSLVKSNISTTISVGDNLGTYATSLLLINESGTTHSNVAGGIQSGNGVTVDPNNGFYSEPTINSEMTVLSENGKDYKIPTRQYSMNYRYSVDYKFESVDRHDKVFNIELANKFFDKFKEEWKAKNGTDFSTYELKFIYGDGRLGESIGISMQNQLKRAFGDQVTIGIRGYSPQVYESFRSEGKFDLVYSTITDFRSAMDILDPTLFVKSFLYHDVKSDQGTFTFNKTGGWTFDDWFEKIEALSNADKTNTLDRLNIHESDYDVLRQVLKFTPYEDNLKNTLGRLSAEKERVKRFRSWLIGTDYNQDGTIYKIVGAYNGSTINPKYKLSSMRFNALVQFDKIALEESPVIPVTVVGQGWMLNRMHGSYMHGEAFQFEFAFDKEDVPRDDLRILI